VIEEAKESAGVLRFEDHRAKAASASYILKKSLEYSHPQNYISIRVLYVGLGVSMCEYYFELFFLSIGYGSSFKMRTWRNLH
jgi:predicted TPR repeat methyltransferase